MEIKSAQDMAKWLQAMSSFSEEDDVLEVSDSLEVGPCIVNTFSIRNTKTNKSYLVNIKEVK